jgi:hypothetical protein
MSRASLSSASASRTLPSRTWVAARRRSSSPRRGSVDSTNGGIISIAVAMSTLATSSSAGANARTSSIVGRRWRPAEDSDRRCCKTVLVQDRVCSRLTTQAAVATRRMDIRSNRTGRWGPTRRGPGSGTPCAPRGQLSLREYQGYGVCGACNYPAHLQIVGLRLPLKCRSPRTYDLLYRATTLTLTLKPHLRRRPVTRPRRPLAVRRSLRSPAGTTPGNAASRRRR